MTFLWFVLMPGFNVSDMYATPNFKLTIGQLVADWCGQLDSMILLVLMFMLTFYVVRVFVFPRSLQSLKSLPLSFLFGGLIKRLFERLESFLDTACLFGSLLMLYFFLKQKTITFGYKVWFFVLFGVVFLVVLVGFLEWMRGKNVKT
jgi:hypothetical protein